MPIAATISVWWLHRQMPNQKNVQYKYRIRAVSCVQRYRQHSTPMNDSTLSVYTSTITAWLHMNPLKPSISPATQPPTSVMRLAKRASMPPSHSIPSMIRAEARHVSNASRPLDTAAANADESATRNAMFEIGTSFVNSHVYSVHTG